VQTWAKRFAIVFGIGFTIYVYAVGAGMAIGQSTSEVAGLRGLRYLGGGLMVGGMTLWIAKSRIEGDRPGLNPMFGILLVFSTALLLLGAIASAASGEVFLLPLQGGLASAVLALVVGLLSMVIAPPEPTPAYDYPWMNPAFDPSRDAYAAGQVVPTAGYADDLTRIQGIDEKVIGALAEAGLHHFSELANTSPETLREILEDAGLGTIDPATWPEQALLADNADWDALEELQAKLAEAEQPA